jgi:signal transduction histidine kinase
MSQSIPDYLRTHKAEISADWERAVVEDLKVLAKLERGALLDHLPEVLNGLAAWVEGKSEEADVAFAALADGHAIQRLGFGIELPVVNIEYSWLRSVIMKHLLAIAWSPQHRLELIALNEGLDRAIQFAVRRYTEHRDYVRDRFISILGHDLRNPLGSAAWAAHALLEAGTLADLDRKRVLTISRAAERMDRMIRDVLDFARGHLGGGIPANPTQCDMGELCRSVVEEAEGAHPERRIEISTTGMLNGTFDRDRVFQAVANLLGNAIQHGDGPIAVAVWEADDHASLFTRVTNRGRAIPAELIPKLFDPFTHAGDETKGNLGLGLFIVAQVARAHGATYDVSSSDAETAFTIHWPRAPRSETPGRP